MSESSDPSVEADPVAETDEAYCAACNQSFTIDAQFCPNDGAKLVKLKARVDTLIGRVFDNRYEVRAPLGHGGMGTVYKGWQLSVDREIAIKVIHPKLASDRAIAKRFFREARLASRLQQANIVGVFEFGQTDDEILYLVMELLRGRPLSKDLEPMRPLPMKRIKSIGMQLCDALGAAHAQGIIHRDLKPGNIVILDDPPGRDVIKVLDFGLAKSLVQENTSLVTRTDAILGTPLYMPPEQILGKTSDQTADLYSLGCIIYQLATGRPPYVGENVNVVLASHVRDPIPEVGDNVPDDLRELIQKLMRKDPAERFQNAADVHAAIAALGDDPNSILTTRAWSPIPRGVRSDVVASVAAPSAIGTARSEQMQVALALTAATPIPAGPPSTHPSLDQPPVTRRWMLPVIALALLGIGGVVAFKLMQREGTSPATTAVDAPLAVVPDAGVTVADAAIEADSAVAVTLDAADKPDAPRPANNPPPRRDAGVPPSKRDAGVPPRDATIARPPPDAPAVTDPPRDAGPSKPPIDLVPTTKKKAE